MNTSGYDPAETLVVAYAFAPDADTSAVAASKRVAAQGRPVDVISHALDDLRRRDPSLEELVSRVVRRHTRLSGPTSFGGWGAVSAFCRTGEATVRDWEAVGPGYTRLFSRAHWVASHVLAALLVADRPGLVWRAEISDPLARRATGEPRPGSVPEGPFADRLAAALTRRGVRVPDGSTTYAWAETLAYVLADEVVFTSVGQRDHCLDLVVDPVVRASLERSARVEPHATLGPEWYVRREPPLDLDPGRRHVGYFGGFYASQDPTALLRAVAGLGQAERERLQMHLFTGPSEALSASVAEHGVGDVVLVRDRLPFLDFLAASRQMDLLLAVDAWPVPGERAPHVRLSKLSDYLGADVPIWGVVSPGSDLSRQALARCTPLGHVTAARQVLTGLARSGR